MAGRVVRNSERADADVIDGLAALGEDNEVLTAALLRTARKLMDGLVF